MHGSGGGGIHMRVFYINRRRLEWRGPYILSTPESASHCLLYVTLGPGLDRYRYAYSSRNRIRRFRLRSLSILFFRVMPYLGYQTTLLIFYILNSLSLTFISKAKVQKPGETDHIFLYRLSPMDYIYNMCSW